MDTRRRPGSGADPPGRDAGHPSRTHRKRHRAGPRRDYLSINEALSATTDRRITGCRFNNGLAPGVTGTCDFEVGIPSELDSRDYYSSYEPAIDTSRFPGTNNATYWTANRADEYESGAAWSVSFLEGKIGGAFNDAFRHRFVRCVHGEKMRMGGFRDNDNGTVTNRGTGVIWQQDDDGQRRSWSEAKDDCRSLKLAGRTDWRLPENSELLSLIDFEGGQGTYRNYFPNALTPSLSSKIYWSATASAQHSLESWVVKLTNSPNTSSAPELFDQPTTRDYWSICVRN